MAFSSEDSVNVVRLFNELLSTSMKGAWQKEKENSDFPSSGFFDLGFHTY